MKILLFSSLFPHPAQPHHGIFVETRLRHTLRHGGIEARVVAPVPWFPFTSKRFGTYAAYAKAPRHEVREGLVIEHPRYPVIPKFGMTLAPTLMYRAVRATVQRLREAEDFDLIDAHYFYPDGVAAAWLARDLGKPLVITGRGTDLNFIPQFTLPRRMIVAAAERATHMVTVCQSLKDDLVALGTPAEKVSVLRNGVDLERFSPLDKVETRRALGLRGPLLLSVGHLIERKGHHLIVQSLTDLPDVHLAIVGEGPMRRDLERMIADNGLEERVHLIGAVPQTELSSYYSAADALVLASSREGWANVLLESMACGTPVAATAVSGTPELVTDPAAGRIIERRSVEAIVETLKDLLSNPPARAETRSFAERFGWDEIAAGQLSVFRQAAQHRLER